MSRVSVKLVAAILAAFVVQVALLGATMSPATALAAEGDELAAGTSELTAQASGLASSNAATINKTAIANAKAIVSKAKAKSGTTTTKLKKIFTYIATDKKWRGAFEFGSYYHDFCMKANATEKAKYYTSYVGPATMKGLYKKYAIDAFKLKKASCYHYAALFGVAAKQALGKKATVKIAVGTAKMVDSDGASYWNNHHSWVEVTMGKKTYVYDTQQGNKHSKDVGKKSDFGKYCGQSKASMKSIYKNYKGAKYCVVTL